MLARPETNQICDRVSDKRILVQLERVFLLLPHAGNSGLIWKSDRLFDKMCQHPYAHAQKSGTKVASRV